MIRPRLRLRWCRDRPVAIAWVCSLILLLLLSARPAIAATGPNILFLLSDDQRFDTIHALGNSEIRTPNLDRLVRRGTTFTRAAIMGGGHGAICVPSRAMLMTGRTLFRATTAYESNSIPGLATTWPQALRQRGYDTFGIGKWHNDRATYARSFSGGGPVFFGGMAEHERVPVHDFDPTGVYAQTNERIATTFSSDLFADAAIRVLQQRRATDSPFALYVAFTSPHDPRTPPSSFANQYSPDKVSLPASFRAEHEFDNGELTVRDERLLPWPRTPEAIRRETALYYGMISHLDAAVGRLLQALEASPFGTNTIIVFAGDNGLAIGRHGLLGKQSLYDHSIRVPLIMAGPGIRSNRRSDALCYLLDVMPTLCELTGIQVPQTAEGVSLAGILRGSVTTVRPDLFGAYRMSQRSIRDDRWKLIEYPEAKIRQLFDLRRDPDETVNLADRPEYQKELQRLQARLQVVAQTLGDPIWTNAAGTFRTNAAGRSDNLEAAALARVTDDPKLPRVLLIGDSISIGYTRPTRGRLESIANVHRIPENGGSTTNGLARLESWLGTNRWDVIHFNWGLHDLKVNPDGSNWVPLPAYEANLEQLMTRLRATGARLIWATTTPVPQGKLNPVRRPADVLLYNRAADGVMQRHAVTVDDLNAEATDDLARGQLPANVHFTPAGYEDLARRVARSIREALPPK